MVVSDHARAARVLQHINYYRLRAYWLSFEDIPATSLLGEGHVFKSGTDFDKVVGLYVFDRQLRLLLLEAIERVEIAMRTHWAQVLAERHGSHAYLDKNLFKDSGVYHHCLEMWTTSCNAAKKPLFSITAANTTSLPDHPFGQLLSC